MADDLENFGRDSTRAMEPNCQSGGNPGAKASGFLVRLIRSGGKSKSAIAVGTLALLAPVALASCSSSTPAAKPSAPGIAISARTTPITSNGMVKCTYNAHTHMATATGTVEWVPTAGGGALGTVTTSWSGKGNFAVASTTPQFFQGPWTLTSAASEQIRHCSVIGQFAPPTAETVYAMLQRAGLPVTGLIAYDATSDPNHLLGRANGYSSKIAWQDTRVDQSDQVDSPGDVEWGGSIEVFPNVTGAQARAKYISAIGQTAPVLGDGYEYILGPILIRVSATLTPQQAAQYGLAIPGAALYTLNASPGTTTSLAG